MVKFVVITGGVLSGIGKGVIASSTGMLLRSYGLRVTSIKIDPYLNIDAGTMSPFEHGEVFILDDGGEADLDLGNYERFVDLTLGRDNNITTGKIYQRVIEKERKGDYLGKTVQVVPHVVNEIQDWLERVSKVPADGLSGEPDVCVVELGGTVGDIESMPFIEALREFQFRIGPENMCVVHVSLVPVLGSVGEQKTKPTQHSVRDLRSLGLNPSVICCRSSLPLEAGTRQKLSLFCQVAPEAVVSVHDVSNLYRVPLLLVEQGMPEKLLDVLKLRSPMILPNLTNWSKMAQLVDDLQTSGELVTIAVVGKYTGLSDSYLSVIKGLNHAANYVHRRLKIEWIDAVHLEGDAESEPKKEAWARLKAANGILVPGGFGHRGIEGKIIAANYARVNKIPYFGICLGLQIAVIEYSRSVLGWAHATSEEFPQKGEPKNVVVFMPEGSKTHMGGTMRLGARKTIFVEPNSISAKLYQILGGHKDDHVWERHRHRYEVNPELVAKFTEAGLHFVGKDETGTRMEIVELPRDVHPYFVGVQYHPEMKSRPMKPSAPFVGLLLAATGKLNAYLQRSAAPAMFEKF